MSPAYQIQQSSVTKNKNKNKKIKNKKIAVRISGIKMKIIVYRSKLEALILESLNSNQVYFVFLTAEDK